MVATGQQGGAKDKNMVKRRKKKGIEKGGGGARIKLDALKQGGQRSQRPTRSLYYTVFNCLPSLTQGHLCLTIQGKSCSPVLES
jgi:hypothetical protein